MTRSSVTASNLFSLSSSEISAWNGWELDKDWALNFKFKRGFEPTKNYGNQYIFRWELTSTYDAYTGTTFESGNQKYHLRLKHNAGASPGQMNLDIPYTTISASDVQWLFSYNKQGYTAGGSDNDPGWSTTTNGAGLSVYYHESTDGGTSYSAWTQLTGGLLGSDNLIEATEVVKQQQATFGAINSAGGTELHTGSEITDIELWNTTRLTSEI